MNNMPSIEETSDAALVAACLGGDREAYGQIVARYQRLLCSLAYSAMGSLSESEDMAQEAFVEGWRKLSTLREPAKLRSWLCGILRFKVSHRRRSNAKEPSRMAESMEEAVELVSGEEAVEETAMREEEKELLWQALEQVPELYREPLVLYYREHRSIEHVAFELDLTESTVKQRLFRGRKMLQEKMMTFVEDALARSTPGRVFTMGVLAALPAMAAPSAKAAGLGAAAVKAGSWFKWMSVAAFVASVSGFVSSFFALRASLDQARTPLERRDVVKTVIKFVGISVLTCLGIFLLSQAALAWSEFRDAFMVAALALIALFIVMMPVATYRILKAQRMLRSAERLRHPELFEAARDKVGSKTGEYRSRASLFGVPLVHARFAKPELGDPPVFGWIAMGGDCVYGLLFAWGGFAVAPISVGIVSVGVITVGALGLGVLGIGMVGIGLVAFGSIAIGVDAVGSLTSIGWDTATGGGFTIAREAAVGAVAYARHVNDELAWQLVEQGGVTKNLFGLLVLCSVLVIVPVAFYARVVRKRFGRKTES